MYIHVYYVHTSLGASIELIAQFHWPSLIFKVSDMGDGVRASDHPICMDLYLIKMG